MRPRNTPFTARVQDAWRNAAPAKTGVFVNAATADAPAEILIYAPIGDDGWGDGVSATSVLTALAQIGDAPVCVRINSPGGSVFDGMAIYNALKAHTAGVTTQVDGLAASAASFIAMAGSKVTMCSSSMLMIHNAATCVWGDKNDMAATINVLGMLDGQIAAIYAAKTGIAVADLAAMMDAETWLTQDDATSQGFCDEVIGTLTAPQEPPEPADPDNAARAAIVASGIETARIAAEAAAAAERVVAEALTTAIEMRKRRLRLAGA